MNRLFLSWTVLLTFLGALCGITNATAQIGDDDSEYDLRVKAILDELDVDYEITDEGDFKIVLPIGEERSQALFVNSNTEFYDEMEIREVWSLGYRCDGTLPGDVANLLLSNSFDQKIGAWQIYSSGAVTRAIFAVKMSANANLTSLRSIIIAVLKNTDAIEEQLTGNTDEF